MTIDESYISVGNVTAFIHGPLRMRVATMLTYRRTGYQFSRAYRNHQWDGFVKVVDMRTGAFPAGLVPYVVAQLKQEDTHIAVADVREHPELDYCLRPASNCVELLPYQEEAASLALNTGRGVFYHATAAGKTELMVELTRRVQVKALVLVHRKDLLYQTYRRFVHNLDIKGMIGIIGDGRWEPRCVTVSTFQSIYSKAKQYPNDIKPFLDSIGQVHVDEVQHLPADSFGYVMRCLPNARYRFGYSATPFKSKDDREAFIRVVGWTGPVIHVVSPQDGILAGRLVPVDVFLLPAGGGVDDSSWPNAYESGIVYNEARNLQIIDLARRVRASGATLVLVERIEHGRLLSEALRCPFLFGDTSSDDRNDGWQAVRDGKQDLVVASRIADEGLDIPGIRFLILAGGGKAGHVVIQRVGRGMRAVAGKDRLTAFDFIDEGKYLGKHSVERRKTYIHEDAYTMVTTTMHELTGGG